MSLAFADRHQALMGDIDLFDELAREVDLMGLTPYYIYEKHSKRG
jgi:hypothetical protein